MTPRHALIATLPAALSALLLPTLARAQECASDTDCPATFVCEVVGASTCPGIACPPNEPCPPPPACETIEYRECVPGPCESDADCDDGMRCRVDTWETCTSTDVACAPDAPCPAPEPAQCTTETHAQCVYAHEIACTADADCGTGFDCMELESCGCAGSDGTADPATDPAEPGFAPAPEPAPTPAPPPDCSCTPSGEFACVPREIPCATDASCPTDWSCVPTGGGGYCTSGPDSADGGAAAPVCVQEPSVMLCQPPTTGYFGVGVGVGGGVAASDGVAGGEGAGTNGTPTQDPVAPTPTDDGLADPDPSPGDVSIRGASSSGDSGGCTMGPARPGSGGSAAMVALLAGLALSGRRRRAAALPGPARRG